MGKFQFYHINEHYISYLHSIDTRVQYNKGQRRPYVGIVLSINGIDYYVPLESPKPNTGRIAGLAHLGQDPVCRRSQSHCLRKN